MLRVRETNWVKYFVYLILTKEKLAVGANNVFMQMKKSNISITVISDKPICAKILK